MKRLVGEWNPLPLDIREVSSMADFKLKVEFLYMCFGFVLVYISKVVGRLEFPPKWCRGAFRGFFPISTHFHLNIFCCCCF